MPRILAPAAPAAQAAPVDTSPATLDHLLAPIALYPDPLLMQVLAASVNGQEVLDGGNWLLENKSLEGTALDAAAKKAGFGAAMTALFHFPDVVDLMCTQLDWTQQLGAAFSADQAGVLASVQRLRAQAQAVWHSQDHSSTDCNDADRQREAGDCHSACEPSGRVRPAVQPADCVCPAVRAVVG